MDDRLRRDEGGQLEVEGIIWVNKLKTSKSLELNLEEKT